jgi:hypothetical protein
MCTVVLPFAGARAPSWLSTVPSKRGAAVPHTLICVARRPRTSGGYHFAFQVRVRFRFCWIRNMFEFHYLFRFEIGVGFLCDLLT